jgi:hypothetical protein
MLAGLGAAGMSWREAGELIASTPELAFTPAKTNDGGAQR